MAFKIAFIGAGSIGFTRKLIKDILCVPAMQDVEISLMDVDEHNLDMVRQLVERDNRANGLSKIPVHVTTDQREAVRNARYVVNTARVGGLEAFEKDIEIPLAYGVDQCVGDTLSAGGIMYGQRGIPMLLDLCRDVAEVGEKEGAQAGFRPSPHLAGRPRPLILNYANPMAMMTWAANAYGGVSTVGLCHGVQGGHHLLSNALGIPEEELEYVCAGINHQTWYIQLRHKGRDVTGEVLGALEAHPEYSRKEKVRIDMLRRFGYFSTESNGHLSEYLPWYRKRPEELEDWISLDGWILGETGGYLRICSERRNWFEEDFPKWLAEDPVSYEPASRSVEHGSYIIEALETGKPYRGHFNLVNAGTISNLPDDAIIEAPGYVDANGINMPKVGDLPLGCAAVCNASISVQRLAVEAAFRADRTLLEQAMLMDPLVGAVCTPPEISSMTDEMLVALEPWLSQYRAVGAIEEARERLSTSQARRRSSSAGATRKKTRSSAELRDSKEGLNVEERAFRLK
jgi:alpha-galactosidase